MVKMGIFRAQKPIGTTVLKFNSMRLTIYALCLLFLFFTDSSFAQRIGIGTNTPDSSSVLDIKSDRLGLLPPRMIMSNRMGIRNPAEGLLVFQTDSTRGIWLFKSGSWKLLDRADGSIPGQMQYWNGTQWVNIAPGGYGQTLVYCNGVPTWGGCLSLLKTGTNSLITYTTASTSGNSILNDGGSSITVKGICLGLNPNPTIDAPNRTFFLGSGVGDYGGNITGLTPGTRYYYRAFATNGIGTSYGEDSQFTTRTGIAPVISTRAPTNISGVSASSGGIITDSGGANIQARGVCWSTNPNPTIALSTKTNDGSLSGSYTSVLTNLTPNTRYYVRAYATNSFGTGYGADTSFITRTPGPASIRSKAATFIASTTAKSGGIILDSGGVNILAKGVCWSTSPNPTISLPSKTNETTSATNYESLLTNLSPNTLYYVRAYVTTTLGTYYGSDSAFTTRTFSLPFVQTIAALTTVNGSSARAGGNIIDSGFAPIFARGVCWSTNPNPVLGISNQVFSGTGSGRFYSLISGLLPNTTYYLRAFATNAAGTAYGADSIFTTPPTIQPVYTENFDAGLNGWTINSDSSSPLESNWQLKNSPYNATITGISGFKNFTTTQGNGFIIAFPDLGGSGSTTNTTITSPNLNLTGIANPVLIFEHVYRYYNSGNEIMSIQVSTNNGASWSDALILNPANYGTTTSENQSTIKTNVSLSAYAGQPNLRIRFKCQSSFGYYWILDDVNIISQ